MYRYLYLTKHTILTFMPSAGFEPKIPASDRLQTQALNRMDTGIDN